MPSSSASRLSGSLGSLVRADWASACEAKSAQSRSSPEVPDEESPESESEPLSSESEDDVEVVVVVEVSVLVALVVVLVVVDAVLLVPVPEPSELREFATTAGVIGTGSVVSAAVPRLGSVSHAFPSWLLSRLFGSAGFASRTACASS
jgi:hypothetical protein